MDDAETVESVENYLRNIHSKTGHEEVKPCILVCGTLDNSTSIYFILCENCKYKLPTIHEAINLYLKSVMVFGTLGSKLHRAVKQFFEFSVFKTTKSGIMQCVKDLQRLVIKNKSM